MQVRECTDGVGRSVERIGAVQPRRMPVIDARDVGRVGGAKDRPHQRRQFLRAVGRRLEPEKGSERVDGRPEGVGRVGRRRERLGDR